MNLGLLNKTTISDYLTREAAWAWSHGAEHDHLGIGLLYYALVYALRAKTAVCLGSGGGFVPRLMRQAQRDLGMAESCRTILVDGNNSAAGWGAPEWLAEDSFFRTEFPDVELILQLTREAAESVFKKQHLGIDYLHIDADHSFAACLEDFKTYRAFLHEGSVVTLHDTSRAGAGVREVVEHLRTLGDCELVDFPDLGEGTAVVRIGRPMGSFRFKELAEVNPPGAGDIQVTRREPVQPTAPLEKGWKYLESDAFAMRYVLAAHWVESCRSVIEIGGSRISIDQYLRGGPERVVVLDPQLRESHRETLHGRPCRVSRVRARFQDVDWHIPKGAEYGLVMLGLEMQGLEARDWETLYQLVNRAQVTVIEYPPSWPPSCEQFARIRDHTHTTTRFRGRLDLEGNEFGDLTNSWPPRCDRELHVLAPRS